MSQCSLTPFWRTQTTLSQTTQVSRLQTQASSGGQTQLSATQVSLPRSIRAQDDIEDSDAEDSAPATKTVPTVRHSLVLYDSDQNVAAFRLQPFTRQIRGELKAAETLFLRGAVSKKLYGRLKAGIVCSAKFPKTYKKCTF